MKNKHTYLSLLVLVLLATSALYISITISTRSQKHSETEVNSSNQLLSLNVHVKENSCETFSLAETGGNFTQNVQYRNTDSVTVYIEGNEIRLEDALKYGYITEEDIFYYARKDARNGFCKQTVESSHGLSHFTFAYPEYNIRLIYDIFEAPSGINHLISDLCIYIPHIGNTEYKLGTYTDFRSYRTGLPLDLEEWGLTIDVIDASSTGITLTCTQSAGQQIGNLYINGYNLENDADPLERLDGSAHVGEYMLDIQMDGTTEIFIDWAYVYGELPSGEYQLALHIFDEFTDSQVHPLMDDFHDWQVYTIPFTIP